MLEAGLLVIGRASFRWRTAPSRSKAIWAGTCRVGGRPARRRICARSTSWPRPRRPWATSAASGAASAWAEFVSSTPDFTEQHKVMNGASDLIAQALGAAGKHARAAVGVASLPLGAAVEVEALFAVD